MICVEMTSYSLCTTSSQYIIFFLYPHLHFAHKTTMLISSRNVLLLGACCTSTTHGFSTPYASITLKSSLKNSYLDSIGPNEDRRPPMPIPGALPPPPIGQFEDPPYIDLDRRVMDRQSNLFFGREPNYQSVNEDPRQFDMERRSVHLYHVTTTRLK